MNIETAFVLRKIRLILTVTAAVAAVFISGVHSGASAESDVDSGGTKLTGSPVPGTGVDEFGDYGRFIAEARTFQAVLDNAVGTSFVPGAVMFVQSSSGRVWSGAGGVAALDTDSRHDDYGDSARLMRAGMTFRIGSITKLFTSALIMMLSEKGLIDLEEGVEDWFPEYRYELAGITVTQLLNMTSGLPDYVDERLIEFQKNNPDHEWKPSDLVEISLRKIKAAGDGRERAGERFLYSNTNYILLGMLAERAAGESYGRLLDEYILKPFKLENTEAPGSRNMPGDGAKGYTYGRIRRKTGVHDVSGVHPGYLWSAGGMVSNGPDLITFLNLIVSGKLINGMDLDDFFAVPAKMDCPDSVYGFGLYKSGGLIACSGVVPGYSSGLYYVNKTVFAVLTNSEHGLTDPAGKIFEEALFAVSKTKRRLCRF